MGAALLKVFVGGVVIFECSYKAADKDKRKFFCKSDDAACFSSNAPRPTDPRVSLFDTNAGFFRVLITALVLHDSGTYDCVVEEAPNVYIRTAQTLEVNQHALYMQSLVRSALVGKNITINCTYPASSVNDTKYLYKKERMSACPELASSLSPSRPGSKYSLADDTQEHVTTVTIRKLTAEDDGVYWCGMRTGGIFGGVAMTTELRLHVTVLAVLLPLILVSLVLIAVLIYRCRAQQRQREYALISISLSLAVSCADSRPDLQIPTRDTAVQMEDLYENVDPAGLQPDPTRPDAGDETEPTGSQSPGNVYQALDPNTFLEDSQYQTLDTKLNE
ncbi:hypothetical protein ACEWY4_017326 [Coilia grayii]|uniref:Immunoglobulin domain-containing protein n=1 Tax=Coilia grayii TaxID=363190 RepID=A0ABD1JGI9_9TELE